MNKIYTNVQTWTTRIEKLDEQDVLTYLRVKQELEKAEQEAKEQEGRDLLATSLETWSELNNNQQKNIWPALSPESQKTIVSEWGDPTAIKKNPDPKMVSPIYRCSVSPKEQYNKNEQDVLTYLRVKQELEKAEQEAKEQS